MRITRVLATGALGLAAAVGTGVGGAVADPQPAAARASDLTAASSCQALLDDYVRRGLDRVTAYGWGGRFYVLMDGQQFTTAPAPTAEVATSTETGTNVQEAGVDEADIVKVDGTLLVRIQGKEMVTYRLRGKTPRPLGRLSVSGIRDPEILLDGDRAYVIGSGGTYAKARTTVLVIDLADPSKPRVEKAVKYAGELLTSRLHGNVMRVVLVNGLPQLDFRYPGRTVSEADALEYNRKKVSATTLADWLPTEGGVPAVGCEDVTVPDTTTALGTTTAIAMSPAAVTASSVATAADTAYFSQDRLFLATQGWHSVWSGDVSCPWRGCSPWATGSTELYSFALTGTETTYAAAGQVAGTLRDRWSIDFANDSLRLAVGPSARTRNHNSVITMRERGSDLVEVGRVTRLGVGEEIKSVRWFDDLAIVVTFRQTDPLYAIDLTDPDSPVLIGELKIPGFSEYLHPLGKRRMLGIGQAATRRGVTLGAQAALFDVSDLTDLEQLTTTRYPKRTQALAAYDPRQFTWLPDRRTALTVIAKGWSGRTGWVSELTLDGGPMENRMVQLRRGTRLADVRLVPLVDGRVVLIAGDDVSYFRL